MAFSRSQVLFGEFEEHFYAPPSGIDIIGEKDNQLLVMECKWKEKKTDNKQIESFLKNRSYLKTKKD